MICHALLRSRVGYYWQAIREDELAARSLGINTFRYKMIAIVISAGMTAPAGVFYAFYYNNLFPEQTFFILRSIEIILGPIIGGVGTLFGPVIGAFLLTGLSEALQDLLTSLRLRHAGRQARVLRRLPPAGGDGPAARHLAADRAAAAPRPPRNAGGLTWQRSWRSTNVSKNFSGLRAVADVSFAVPEGAIFAVIGPNGAGKTTLFNLIAGVFAPDAGTIAFAGRAHRPAAARRSVPPRHRPHLPDRASVSGAQRRGQRRGRRAAAPAGPGGGDAPRASSSLATRSVRQAPASGRGADACPTASGWRSPARLRPSRSSCCSTR